MKVSIITITFNPGELLDRTALSILNQSCCDFEWLVIDGLSNDQTIAKLKQYDTIFKEKNIPFYWISEPDNGIYDAMNKGLKLAKGHYVWFMNAGDVIASSSTLESILNSISSENIDPDFVYGETLIIDNNGVIMGKRRLKAPSNLTWKSFKMGMLVCHQSMLVKRSLAPSYNLFYRYSSDFDWTIRCLKQAKVILNTGLVHSHFLDGGVSKKKMKASLKERFQIMAENYGLLPTAIRHVWFVCRAGWFKLIHGWI